MLTKRSFKDLPLEGKKVLVRVDYNVPLDKEGNVTDDSRIKASFPTLQFLLEKKAKVILIAHLGRPKGQINAKYSLKPVVEPLKKLLNVPVSFAENCVGPTATDAVGQLKPGEVLLLENLRFHSEEEKAKADFGKELAKLADFFVQDAFGAVHRAHASTTLIPQHLESGAGDLLQKELEFLTKVRSNPTRPFLAILGGAKVSDKIGVVESLLNTVDSLFIGGAMAYTFLKAKGIETGESRVEEESVEFCKSVLKRAQEKNISLLLPADHLIVQDIEKTEQAKLTDNENIPSAWKGVDTGPKTSALIQPIISQAKTIFWNGPAGIFEVETYSKGTMDIAQKVAQVAKAGHTVVVGGGDSVSAVKKAGVANDITFISTGGGASLEFLEGKELPGVVALPDAN
ncbi:phosphoglycerate kinase [bacterium F11]|nr:phosphoglycerate kinase [bacterium F11]